MSTQLTPSPSLYQKNNDSLNASTHQQREVVDLLRDKIRCNALELLSRVDAVENHSRARKATTPTAGEVPPSLIIPHSRAPEDEEKKSDDDPPRSFDSSLQKQSPSAATACSELTKRLHQLALKRQAKGKTAKHDINKHLTSSNTFGDLGLPPHLCQSLYEMGFNRPSAVQSETLPLMLQGRNIIAQAQSGSGKTVAFTLGVLYHIQTKISKTQALVLVPTRELAFQVVEQALEPLSTQVSGSFTYQLAISGTPTNASTVQRAHVVVGTPGKVTDWLKRRVLDLNSVRVFVLDEADAMVDTAFRAKSLLIYKQLSKKCQCLFFSAIYPPLVVDFASKLVKNPNLVLIEDDEELVLDVIKQLWVDTRRYPGGKIMFLADIYALLTIGQSIVFVETCTEAVQVHETLASAGYSVSILHSNMDGDERDLAMKDFRQGKSSVLITTNVLARGANVVNVCLVINCSVPVDRHGCVDYDIFLHRVHRTGRFGRKGTAINLIDNDLSRHALEQIQDHFGATMTQVEADPEALANEIQI